jgi:ATP-binding cassette subfamily B protein/subfamily B ATP-binding cassette protein MsbA
MFNRLIVLLSYALPHRQAILGLFFATLLAAASIALQPWPLKLLVDILTSNSLGNAPLGMTSIGTLPRETLLFLICMASVLMFAIPSALDALLSWGWTVIGRRMVYALATDLFSRLQRRSLLYHRRTAIGETITRINSDCWALYRVFETAVMKPVHALLSIALMLLMMSLVDGFLTVIAACSALVGVAASLFAGGHIRKLGETERTLESDLRSHVQQTMTAIHVVQTDGQERKQQRRLERICSDLLAAKKRSTLLDGLNGLASGLPLNIGAIFIIAISAHEVIAGRITIGSILLFAAYVVALQSQLKNVVGLYPTVQKLRASVARIDEVLRTQPEIADRPCASPLQKVNGHIRFENVCFNYDRDQPVLRDISFEARAGQTVALVGPTGAGKSTLVSMIPRFFDPSDGRVLLDGQDLRDLRVISLRAQIAILLQEPFLFPGSIADNISFGLPNAAPGEIEGAARAARAHEFISRLPLGYQTLIGVRGSSLSGGERQRISLARAFLRNAPILILDEPTSAVDAETEALILEAMQALSRGRTTFIIAHRLTTVQNADQVLVLDRGELTECGIPAELAKAGKLYTRLHELNFKLPA